MIFPLTAFGTSSDKRKEYERQREACVNVVLSGAAKMVGNVCSREMEGAE